MTSAGHSFQHLGIVGFIRAAARAHKLDIYLKQIVYAPNTRPWVAANPPLRNHTSTNGTPGANYHPQKFSLLFLMSSPTFYVRGEWTANQRLPDATSDCFQDIRIRSWRAWRDLVSVLHADVNLTLKFLQKEWRRMQFRMKGWVSNKTDLFISFQKLWPNLNYTTC